VRLNAGNEHKLDFRTSCGLCEPIVLQFETTNAPADFQGYINITIRGALDNFAMVYLDDILIYSNSVEEYEEHFKWVMKQFMEAGLYLKLETCEFHKKIGMYLVLIISMKRNSIDPDKMSTVLNWSGEQKTANGQLNNLCEVKRFLEFCHCYQRFIRDYSGKAEPLTWVTKMEEPF